MELLRQEEREVDECGTGRKNDVLTRFCRKKYKCAMMFLCIIALFFQTAYLIIEKVDSQNLNRIASRLPNISSKLVKFFHTVKFDPNSTTQLIDALQNEYEAHSLEGGAN